MKNKVFLTSSVHLVADSIGQKLRAQEKQLKLLFIDTAAEVEEGNKQWLQDDVTALEKAGFKLEMYSITDKKHADITNKLNTKDGVYIEGGNTFYLLYQAQQSGFNQLIRNYINQGKIYIGTSAGSIIAGPDIYPTYKLEAREWTDKLNDCTGFSLTDLVIFPHWGSKDFKDLYLNQRLDHAYNTKHKIILLNDYQYVELLDEGYKIVDIR